MAEEKEKKGGNFKFRLTEKDIEEEEREARDKGEDWGSADTLFSEDELKEREPSGPEPGAVEAEVNELLKKLKIEVDGAPARKAAGEPPAKPEKALSAGRDGDIEPLDASNLYFSDEFEPRQSFGSKNELLLSAVQGNEAALKELGKRIQRADPREARETHAQFLHFGYSPVLSEAGLHVNSRVEEGNARVTASLSMEKLLPDGNQQAALLRALKEKAGNRAQVDYDPNHGFLRILVAGRVPEEHDLRGFLHPESEHLQTMRSLLDMADEHARAERLERH